MTIRDVGADALVSSGDIRSASCSICSSFPGWPSPVDVACFRQLVLVLLAFDLGILHRKNRELGLAESLWLSAFYIAVAMVFGGVIWWA